jgi:signal peptidase I
MNMSPSFSESESVEAGSTSPSGERGRRFKALGIVARVGKWVLLMAVLAAADYFILSHYILQTVQIQGRSMVPTLHDADRCFLNRWVFHMRPPRRGDVVVLKDPSDGCYAVKRVVASSGDSIFFKDGWVYLNGQKLSEPYLAPHTATETFSRAKEELIVCGRDQYFVLGDNRGNSFDSRMYGPVARQNILGAIVQ